jgi:hypothetical protein
VLWLERAGPAGPADAMVLERAAAVAREVLSRTRGRTGAAGPDPAWIEVVVDATAPEDVRRHAARRLGLTDATTVRAVALPGGRAMIETVDAGRPGAARPATARHPAAPAAPPGRAGVGPAGAVPDLPASWAAARAALRLTAAGTDDDPGPQVVHADEVGGLLLLAAAVGPGTPPIADVQALEHAAASTPGLLATLAAIADSTSLRTAAAALRVHHSTLQDRATHAEDLLGWSLRDPGGRLRLQLALALRRLHRHPV